MTKRSVLLTLLLGTALVLSVYSAAQAQSFRFSALDIDEDDKVSVDEFFASDVARSSPQLARLYFSKMDADANGEVTQKEFSTFNHQARMAKREGRWREFLMDCPEGRKMAAN